MLLWTNGGGATHSLEKHRACLEKAGFAQVGPLSEHRLAAVQCE